MSEENISPESNKESPGAETAAKPSGTIPVPTRLAEMMAESAAITEAARARSISEYYDRGLIRREMESLGLLVGPSQFVGEGNIVDASGNPIEEARAPDLNQGLIEMAREDLKILTISASEFDQLSEKTAEILQEAALAYERMGKDQEEIEQLKTETRAVLAQLRAA